MDKYDSVFKACQNVKFEFFNFVLNLDDVLRLHDIVIEKFGGAAL